MFFNSEFLVLFRLFSFILIKLLCNVDGVQVKDTPATAPYPEVDLTNLNMSIYCKFQPSGGVCSTAVRTSRKHYFDVHLKRCVRFEYGQCPHSYNMFDGKYQCLDACREEAYEVVPENFPPTVFCRYQPDFGECNSYYPSWYYDITDQRCKGFSYSGCGGNRNRFPTALQCGDVCGTAMPLL